MSVSVTPCSVTLKCTRVGVGSVSSSKVEEMAFWMAGAPVSVSTFTELRYKTLQTARTAQSPAQRGRPQHASVSLRRARAAPSTAGPGPGPGRHPAEPDTCMWVRFVLMKIKDLVTQKFFTNLFWFTLILCTNCFKSQSI